MQEIVKTKMDPNKKLIIRIYLHSEATVIYIGSMCSLTYNSQYISKH